MELEKRNTMFTAMRERAFRFFLRIAGFVIGFLRKSWVACTVSGQFAQKLLGRAVRLKAGFLKSITVIWQLVYKFTTALKLRNFVPKKTLAMGSIHPAASTAHSMRIRDVFFLASQMFRNRPLRTFLTISGMGVGIGAILFLVALGFGLQRVLIEKITTDEALLSLDVTSASAIIKLDEDAIRSIAAIKDVEKISPLANVASQMSVGEFNTDVIVDIVEPLYLRLSGLSAKEGKVFQEGEDNVIVISEALATTFNLTAAEAIGVKAAFVFFVPKEGTSDAESLVSEIDIIPHEVPYTIIGVTEENIIPSVFIPRSSVKEIKTPTFSQLKVKVSRDKALEPVRDEILARGFMTSSLSETIDQANTIFRVVQIVLSIFGIISLMVAAIGMFNTLTISLLERTNDIGIMRAIGASRKDIWILFLSESLMMGILGGIVGIAIGFVASKIFNWGINILASVLGGKHVDLFAYPVWFLLFILVVSAVMGFATGIWPARRAANLNPLQALRYK